MNEGITTLITKATLEERLAVHCASVRNLVEYGDVLATVGMFIPKRSLDQNALMWVLCDEIAQYLNKKTKPEEPFTKEDLHDRLLIERYGQEVRKVGQVEVTRVPRSSKFDRAKMGEFLDWMISWALDRRIPLEIPACPEFEKYREAQA